MAVNELKTPERILYLASSHWDREWYRSFQSFRFRLVQVLDDILDTLEREPAFTQFTLDGHTVQLEDYLAIKPENRCRVEALLAAGRLAAGPWYTMPDEYLCSGESLVNNLALGIGVVRALGAEPMGCGYVCDIFGHIAQLPQILRGCGIGGALLGRGTNRAEVGAFFAWQSPDGTRCLTYKVPEELGYGSFYAAVIEPFRSGADSSRERMLQRAEAFVRSELARSPLPYVILTDAMDHEGIHPEAVWLAERLGESFGCPVEIAAPDRLLPLLQQNAGALQTVAGELRATARDMVEHNKRIPHTLSSRCDVKLQNDRCQTLLERTAAPLAALALLAGRPVPQGFFEQIHRYLAKNQTHDSICGCSIDRVSRDMLHRYAQAESIAREIVEAACATLACLEDTGQAGAYREEKPSALAPIDIEARVAAAPWVKLTLFNTEPADYSGPVEACIDFPTGYAAAYGEYLAYEPHNMFRLYDPHGAEVPYQLLEVRQATFTDRPGESYRGLRDRYRVALRADIPAMGHTELVAKPSARPVRDMGSLRAGDLRAENEFLWLAVNTDGTLTLRDKATGRTFHNLLRFRDDGEMGDGWFHAQPVGAHSVYSDGCPAEIALLEDGSERCAFSITRRLRVPAGLERGMHGAARSGGTTELVIQSRVTLARGARWLAVRTTVPNTARDHRLRLLLETGVPSPWYEADQAYAVVRRRAGLPTETHDWKECDRGDAAFSHLVQRRDDTGQGLALLSRGGLHECFVRDDPAGTIEITLLRCFGNTFLTDGEPDGQLQGTHHLDYALLPLSGGDSTGAVMRLADRFRSEIPCYSATVPKGYTPVCSGAALRLTSANTALSTLKPAGRAGFLCLRLVNYGSKADTAVVECGRSIAEAQRANLLEESVAELDHNGTRLQIPMGGCEVATVLLRLE